jgi:CRP/FNR family transcriptional regulator, cyclic AMP receptor protein
MELQGFIQRTFTCTADVAQAICRRARRHAYPAPRSIVRQGEACVDVYLLVIGRARALLITVDGGIIQLWEYGPGDLFGAVSAGRGSPETAEVAAVEDVQAAVFRGVDFLSLVERHACVGRALSQMLVRQLAHATELFVVRATLSATGRIYAELLRRAQEQGGRTISPPPVLADLALAIQSSRETVSRTINALQRRGIIDRDAEKLTIIAPARLEEMIR